jgi:hypothetical protein
VDTKCRLLPLECFEDEPLGAQLRLMSELGLHRLQIVSAVFFVPAGSWPVEDEPIPGSLVANLNAHRVGGTCIHPRRSNNHAQGIGSTPMNL